MVEELRRAFASEVHGSATKRITGTAGGATTLVAFEQNVEVTQPASGTHTITLPPVAECKDRVYMIAAPGSGAGTVTVQSADDDLPIMADLVLDVADSYLMLIGTGVRFLVLGSDDVQGTNTVITASAGGSTALTVDQQNVGVTKFSSGTHTITLPAVATCVGRVFTIVALGAGAGTVTVASTGVLDLADRILTEANSFIVLVSDGVRFIILASGENVATKVITATAGGATTLLVNEENVGVTKFSSATHTISLPAVAECKGRIYTITALGSGAGTVTVDTQDDDVPVLVDHVLSAQNSYVVIVSDGVRFYLVDSEGDTAIKAIVCTDGGATQLLLEEQYVTCTAPDGTTHTITLPAVATCMGRIYSIYCTTNDTGTVTIASDGLGDVVLTTTDDNLIVLSDGVRFHVLLEVST